MPLFPDTNESSLFSLFLKAHFVMRERISRDATYVTTLERIATM